MIVTEFSIAQIRDVLVDMRREANAKREKASHMHGLVGSAIAADLITEAVMIEHWCNQLETAIGANPR